MADRYWILGTGNWNSTANWSTTSGGTGGASVPTSADNAYFDGLSDRQAEKSVTSITRSGTTATVTSTAHGYSNGDSVTIYGADQTEYNGTFTIANKTNDTFDITVSGSPATPATGTITCAKRAAFTVTLNVTGECNDFIAGDGVVVTALNQTMTFAGSSAISIYGSWYNPATKFVNNYSGAMSFRSTTTGKTITTNGIAISSYKIIFNGNGGEWTLGSSISISGGGTIGDAGIEFITGTFKTANYNTSSSRFYSTSTSNRTIELGSSTVNVYLSSSTALFTFNTTNLIFNAGTSTIYSYSGGQITFDGSGLTLNNVTLGSWGTTVTINGSSTYNNITTLDTQQIVVNGSNTINGTFSISSSNVWGLYINQNNTINNFTIATISGTSPLFRTFVLGGNLTITGTFSVQSGNTDRYKRWYIISNTPGTPRTISANAIDFGDGIDFRNITAAGTAAPFNISTKSIGDLAGNSNITFPAPKTVYWNLAGSQNWNATAWATTPTGTPSAANFPLAQDTAVITESGAAGTITINAAWVIGNLTFDNGSSPRTSAATLNFSSNPIFYGDVKFSSGTVLTGTGTSTFSKLGTQNLTSAGKLFLGALVIDNGIGSLVLQDNVSSNSSLNLATGNINLNGKTLLGTAFNSDNSNVRSIAFNGGKIQLNGSGGVVNMYTTTNFSYTGVPEIEATYTGSAARAFVFGYSNDATETQALNLTITAGTGVVDFLANNSVGRSTAWNNITFLDAFTGSLGQFQSGGQYGFTPLVYGNLVMPKNASAYTQNTGTWQLRSGTKTQNVTIGNLAPGLNIFTSGPGSVVVQNNGTVGVLTLASGVLNLNGKVVTATSFSSSASNQRNLIFGSGQLNLTGSGTVWNTDSATNMTITPGTGKIVLSNNTNTARSFYGGGLQTFPEVEIGGDTGTATTTFFGANKFAKLSSTKQVAYTIVFPNAITKVNNWNINGSSGNLVTLSRTGGSGTFTLEYTGNQYVVARYLSISNSAATPTPNRWFAVDSTNGGGNTGWVFDAPRFAQFIPFFGL